MTGDADLRGLRAIADLPHVVRRIVVSRGDRRQKTAGGIDILPITAFLAHLEGQSLFPWPLTGTPVEQAIQTLYSSETARREHWHARCTFWTHQGRGVCQTSPLA